jgi:hypothetical protein
MVYSNPVKVTLKDIMGWIMVYPAHYCCPILKKKAGLKPAFSK